MAMMRHRMCFALHGLSTSLSQGTISSTTKLPKYHMIKSSSCAFDYRSICMSKPHSYVNRKPLTCRADFNEPQKLMSSVWLNSLQIGNHPHICRYKLRNYSTSSDLCYTDVKSHNTVFNTGYLDVGPRDGTTIVAIHGAPGFSRDFDALIEVLPSKGVRLIVPSIPGDPTTTFDNIGSYDESTQSRATFVIDFLKALGLERVDMVLGHSLGAASAYYIAANTTTADSVCVSCGVGHRRHRSVRPKWFITLAGQGLVTPIIHDLIKSILKFSYKFIGFKELDHISVDQLASAVLSAARADFESIQGNLEKINKKEIPVLYAFCRNDFLLEKVISLETIKYLGIQSISHYSKNEELLSGPSKDGLHMKRALMFDNGGHYAHRKHKEVVSKCILDILHRKKRQQAGGT